MKNKILLAVVSLAVTIGALVGCSDGGEQKAPVAPSASAAASEKASSATASEKADSSAAPSAEATASAKAK